MHVPGSVQPKAEVFKSFNNVSYLFKDRGCPEKTLSEQIYDKDTGNLKNQKTDRCECSFLIDVH